MDTKDLTPEEVQAKKQKILNCKPIKWMTEHPQIVELIAANISMVSVLLGIYHDKSEMKDSLYLTSRDKDGRINVVKTKCKIVRSAIPGQDEVSINDQKGLTV